MSASGPSATCRDVRFCTAIGGKADVNLTTPPALTFGSLDGLPNSFGTGLWYHPSVPPGRPFIFMALALPTVLVARNK
jgi:hypothetical protein